MRLEKFLSVIFMSVVLCVAAGVFGLFFNIVNPNGLSLIPKSIIIVPSNIKSEIHVKPKIEPFKKSEVKVPVKPVIKPKHAATQTVLVTVKKSETAVARTSPVIGKKTEPSVVKGPVTKEEPIVDGRKLDIAQVKLIFDKKKVVFVDARPEYTYIDRHIKGAISLSASRFNFQFDKIKDKLNKDELYVVYCSSVTCHLSDITADHLKENGFKNVKVFVGGWDAWIEADYPIEGLKVKKDGDMYEENTVK